ncbi:MAG TPA: glutamyl-tRNA reductase [Actinomycetota bacterium]|nr:glutamyl-tRNA reductase [Actinomycetota bacterium]
MSIVVVGVNHRTAPIELLERLSISQEKLTKALHQLDNCEHVLEGAILSTCNRVEVYAVVSRFHGGAQDLKNFLSEFCHVPPEDFTDRAYTYHDEGALKHLFRVAAGIDSMVVGESEILGQVRRAFQIAQEEGMVHRVLGAAGRRAQRVGKRARTETAIGRNPVSVSSAAVELARRAFGAGDLSDKSVAIVGAGKMGGLAARALRTAGADRVTVVNRSEERAEALAKEFGAEALPLDDLPRVLSEADIVISSTTAPQTVIDRSLVEASLTARSKAPLFMVDIAVPRDVDPDVGDLDGVVLRDIDDLKGVVEVNRESRLGEVSAIEEIIASELEHFLAWERSTEMDPRIVGLLARANESEIEEIERLLRGHFGLDDEPAP